MWLYIIDCNKKDELPWLAPPIPPAWYRCRTCCPIPRRSADRGCCRGTGSRAELRSTGSGTWVRSLRETGPSRRWGASCRRPRWGSRWARRPPPEPLLPIQSFSLVLTEKSRNVLDLVLVLDRSRTYSQKSLRFSQIFNFLRFSLTRSLALTKKTVNNKFKFKILLNIGFLIQHVTTLAKHKHTWAQLRKRGLKSYLQPWCFP